MLIAEPGVYETNVELGLWSPVPWYYLYIQSARYLGVGPWELVDEPTLRSFWHEATRVVMLAESDAAAHNEPKSTGTALPPNTPRRELQELM